MAKKINPTKSKRTSLPARPLFLPSSLPAGYSDWQNWYSQNPNPPTLPIVPEAQPKAQSEELDYNNVYHRQAATESGFFNPAIVKGLKKSAKGAIGMAQAMPSALQEYKKKFKKPIDVTTPENAVKFQKWVMDDLRSRPWANHPKNESDSVTVAKALAAYNYGATNLVNTLNQAKEKGIDIYSNKMEWLKELPKETSDYVGKILLGNNPEFEKQYAKVKDTYSDLYNYREGGLIKRADGSYSKRGLWDNIRANKGSGKKPTKEMLRQERKIRAAEKKEDGGPVYNWIPPNYPRVGARNAQGGWLDQYEEGGDVPHDYMYNEGNVSSYLPGTSVHPAGITNVPDSPCGPGFTIQYDETGNPVCMPVAIPNPSVPAPSAPTPVLAGATPEDYYYAARNPRIYSSQPLETYSEIRTRNPRIRRRNIQETVVAEPARTSEYMEPLPMRGINPLEVVMSGANIIEPLSRKQGRVKDKKIKTYKHRGEQGQGLGIGRFFKNLFGGCEGDDCYKFEAGGTIEDQKIPDTTAYEFGDKFMAYPDPTLTNYQNLSPKSKLPDGKIVDATPEIPAYAHGATVWNKRLADEQMSAAHVVGPDTSGTQVKNTYPDRMSGAENPTNYKIGDYIPVGMNYKSPAAGTYDYNKDIQPYYKMRLHAPDTRRMAYGGYVPMYGKGGFLKGLGDVGLFLADTTLSPVNQDIIGNKRYSDTGFGKTVKDISNVTGSISNSLAPMAANMIMPGAGTALSMAQGFSNNFVDQDKDRLASKTGQIGNQIGQGLGLASSVYSLANPQGFSNLLGGGGGSLAGAGDLVSSGSGMMAKHGGRIPGLRWHQLNPGVSAPAGIYTGPTTQRGITFADGGDVPPYITSDPKEFAKRQQAYKDSLSLFKKYYDPQLINDAKKYNWDIISVPELEQHIKNLGQKYGQKDKIRPIYFIDDAHQIRSNASKWVIYPQYAKPKQKVIFNPEITKMPMRGMTSIPMEELMPQKTNVLKTNLVPAQYMDTRGEWSDKPQVPPVYTEEQLLKMGYRAPQKKANGGWLDSYEDGGEVPIGKPYLNPATVQATLASAYKPITNTLGRVISTPQSREKERREKVIAKDESKYSVEDYKKGIQEPGAGNSVLDDPLAMAFFGGFKAGQPLAKALGQYGKNVAAEATMGISNLGPTFKNELVPELLHMKITPKILGQERAQKLLQKNISPENLRRHIKVGKAVELGSGGFGSVYNFPNYPELAVKKGRLKGILNIDPDYLNKDFSTIPEYPGQMHPKYYGVKKYPERDEELIFMENMKDAKSLYNLGSKQLEDIPESAFKDLYENIEKLRAQDVGVDYKGDNILYDPKKKKFVLIDLFEGASKTDDQFWQEKVLRGVNIKTPKEEVKDKIKKGLERKIDSFIAFKGADLMRRYPEGTRSFSLSKTPTSEQGELLFDKLMKRGVEAKSKIKKFKQGGWLDNL